jgi:hypothetical protein
MRSAKSILIMKNSVQELVVIALLFYQLIIFKCKLLSVLLFFFFIDMDRYIKENRCHIFRQCTASMYCNVRPLVQIRKKVKKESVFALPSTALR